MLAPFEYKIFCFLQAHKIQNASLILACSGGLDSMVLAKVLERVSPRLNLQVHSCFIHHGPSGSKTIQDYRDKTRNFLQAHFKKQAKDLIFYQSKKELKSEACMRDFRLSSLKQALTLKSARFLFTAHHKQDLLETRVINLIRGCGQEGISTLKKYEPPFVRPFLQVESQEIQDYAKKYHVDFIEDPSNKDSKFFRNWLRKTWLPLLEKNRQGSLNSLARSLNNLSQLDQLESLDFYLKNGALDRALLMEQGDSEQKRILALYMRQKKIKNYSLSHIEELRKHLLRQNKEFEVKILKKSWKITAQFVSVDELR